MNELMSQRVSLVGRTEEKAKIEQAIRGMGSTVLFLEGSGGIGKTVLLQQADTIAESLGCLHPPIIDFYDTRMHSHQGLQDVIAQSLDPARASFQEYWDLRAKEPQAELWEVFLQGYTRVSQSRRVVLRLDTVERVIYAQDSKDVLEDCEVSVLDAPSWQWLLKRIGELPNTSVLLAARPTPENQLRNQLEQAYQGKIVFVDIGGFTLEETKEYFNATDLGRQVVTEAPAALGKIHTLSGGRPILIALALDWLARGMWDRRTIEEADAQNFERALVEQVRQLKTPLDQAVKYVALCRKGCNADLLARLMKLGRDEAQQIVQQLATLAFVKPERPGSHGLFFLHDEMYDLIEKYVWLPEWPDYSEQARLDREIVKWYDEEIKSLGAKFRGQPDRQQRSELRRLQQLYQAEQLYYEFDADPRIGYREYYRLDEEAITSRELEFDTWLRNEALWFTSNRAWRKGGLGAHKDKDYPRKDPAWEIFSNGKKQIVRSPAVDHDCRRRWINRYIARNQYDKAIQVAEKLLSKLPLEDEPELYRGGMRIALAAAQAFVGGKYLTAAFENFRTGITQLEKVALEDREKWLYPYLLGMAYLYQGFAFTNALRLKDAFESNAKAISLFREIEQVSRLAETLNNQSYVLARQGQTSRATVLCKEALDIRQGLGDEYGIALSLNTLGIINEREARPFTAIRYSEQARTVFKEINDLRGIILANINLGRSYRRKGRSPDWEHEDKDFETGKSYLEEALRLQEELGASADLFYRIEAFNELGCLYRDWAATWLEKFGDRQVKSNEIDAYLERAESFLQKAIDLTQDQHGEVIAGQELQHVDCLEDFARVAYVRAQITGDENAIREMEERLEKAHAKAQHYRQCHPEWNEIQLILGKIYLQYARLNGLKKGASDVMAQYYALAAGHIESYSKDAPELQKISDDASKWLSAMKPKQARQFIDQMRDTLQQEQLQSERLREAIDTVVYSRLGEGWTKVSVEVSNG